MFSSEGAYGLLNGTVKVDFAIHNEGSTFPSRVFVPFHIDMLQFRTMLILADLAPNTIQSSDYFPAKLIGGRRNITGNSLYYSYFCIKHV